MDTSATSLKQPLRWWQRWRPARPGRAAAIDGAALAEFHSRIADASRLWTAHVGTAQSQMGAAIDQLLGGFNQILAGFAQGLAGA